MQQHQEERQGFGVLATECFPEISEAIVMFATLFFLSLKGSSFYWELDLRRECSYTYFENVFLLTTGH